jgi:hypothetical protein
MVRDTVSFKPIALSAYNEDEKREAYESVSGHSFASSTIWSITTNCNSLCTARETEENTCFVQFADAVCRYEINEPNVLQSFLSFDQLGNTYIVRKVR